MNGYQISFLMFSRLLDMRESTEEKKWKRKHKGKKFPGVFFKPKQQHLRWSHFRHVGGDEMLRVVRDEVFPHFRGLGGEGATFGEYMKDAQLMIPKASLLNSAVNMIEELPLASGDTKGDLYEYLLSKLTTAGINGQFRTPRHIIRLMVDLIQPEPTWVIGDPACGTGGFLVGVMEHLRERFTSKEGRLIEQINGDKVTTYTGDLLEPYRQHIQSGMFHGFDFDVTMLRIAAMNIPGTILSQLGIQTRPSNQCARTIVSTESAISSREWSEYFMPSWPMAIPSSTPIVLKTKGTPPAARTASLTNWPTASRWTWPGMIST